MEYNYEQLKELSPKEFSNFYYNNLRNSFINKIIENFINDFLSESDDGSIFLMGNGFQLPGSTAFIEVLIQDTEVYLRQILCGNDYIKLSLGPNKWYTTTLDKLKRALFLV